MWFIIKAVSFDEKRTTSTNTRRLTLSNSVINEKYQNAELYTECFFIEKDKARLNQALSKQTNKIKYNHSYLNPNIKGDPGEDSLDVVFILTPESYYTAR